MTEKPLKEILKEQRKYAPFFEWPDTQIKERGVVQSLLESMEVNGLLPFSGLRPGPSPNQAPDCNAEDEIGEIVAIEVTEFVSSKAVEMNQRGKVVYRDWMPDEVIVEVQKIITKKDRVRYFWGPYSKIVLVIHTDEIALDYETYTSVLSKVAFEARKIEEVYFLFSYHPQVRTYPYVKLQTASTDP